VGTCRGSNDDSDNYLVITRVRANISMSKYNLHEDKTIRHNISNLKQTEARKGHEQNLWIYIRR
jgi:hypothetical protein